VDSAWNRESDDVTMEDVISCHCRQRLESRKRWRNDGTA
jgi:hypothetical protein